MMRFNVAIALPDKSCLQWLALERAKRQVEQVYKLIWTPIFADAGPIKILWMQLLKSQNLALKFNPFNFLL
jgi:hypothetical protein